MCYFLPCKQSVEYSIPDMRKTSFVDLNYSQICVLGAQFEDIYEVARCACLHEPKDGVYVGEDSERYPCFDYEDFASETRYYWNFVFATSESEMLDFTYLPSTSLCILCGIS